MAPSSFRNGGRATEPVGIHRGSDCYDLSLARGQGSQPVSDTVFEAMGLEINPILGSDSAKPSRADY